MRTYWLKIVLGAFGVFAVGMVIVSMARSAKSNVEAIAEGTGPITIPLALLPFEIDGERVGTLRRLRIFRDSLQDPTRVEVLIAVADSVSSDRFTNCILGIEPQGGKVQPNDFRCYKAEDTVGKTLVEFGDLQLRDRVGSYKLFAPEAHVEELKRGSGDQLTAEEHRAREVADSVRESIADSIHAYADSVHEAGAEKADSVRRAPLVVP